MLGLLRAELRKLRGIRYFPVLLILLFAADLYVCYRSGVPIGMPRTMEYHETLTSFADLCREDPAAYEQTKAEMKAAIDAHDQEERAKAKADPNYVRDYSGTHYYSEYVDDDTLLHSMELIVSNREMFGTQIDQILRQAEKTMRDMKLYEGLTMEDYRYIEQAYVHQTYSALKDTSEPVISYIRGWDTLFSFHYGDVFLMAVLLLLSSLLFLPEKQTGMLPILLCTKKGGRQTALAKLGVMSILSVGITLLFTLGGMAVLQLGTGFSDWNIPVQSISDLRIFPRAYSIKEYFFLFLGTKLLGALAFSAVCTFLSVVFYHPLLSYGSGAALAGLSFWMYNLPLSVSTYLPQQLNLFSIMAVKPLSIRLRTVNFFGRPIQSITFALIETILLWLLFSLLTVWLHSRSCGAVRFARFGKAVNRLTEKGKRAAAAFGKALHPRLSPAAREKSGKKTKTRPPKRYAYSLFGWELRKVFFGEPLLLLIALVMTVAQVLICTGMREDSRQDGSYRIYELLYLPEIEGPLTEEKSRFLDEEYATQQAYSTDADGITEAYGRGEVSDQEYLEYQAARNRSQHLLPVLRELLARRDDFKARLEADPESVPGNFIDYKGYEALMGSGFSLPLFLLLLFVCAASFAKEYGGKSQSEHFAMLLRSTYRGRQDTFRRKCLACCLVGLLFGAIFYGIELGVYLSLYHFPLSALRAPLFSLGNFGCYHGEMRLLTGLLLVYIMKFVSILLTVLLLCAISALCKNLLQGLTISLLGTMLPSLLVYLGLQSARYLSYAEWMAAGPMLHFSMEADLLGGDLGLYLAYTLTLTAVTALLLFLAARQHNGGGRPIGSKRRSETAKEREETTV